MKFVPNAVSTRVARTALVGQYHSPKILFAAGIVGFGATVVLAARATLKADEVLRDAEKDRQQIETLTHSTYTEDDRRHDLRLFKVKTATKLVKLYAPAAGVGVLSVAALTGSHQILNRRNTAITAAYATIEKAFSEYRERVRNELGDEKDDHFRYGVDKREVVVETDKGPEITTVDSALKASGYAKFFDQFNPNWQPNADLNLYWLKCQQTWLNDKLRTRGHLFLNEVYEELGFDHTEAGAVVGWWVGKDSTGDEFVDFGLTDGNNDQVRAFVNGRERAVLLDFNVDGSIYKKLRERA